jgi:hypothetical protein
MSVFSASNITAMRAISDAKNDDVVEVAGYESTDDGGGGTFFFEATHITDVKVSSVAIAGATEVVVGTDPPAIVVTTAADHSFVNGQAVLVADVGGNTNANGSWWVKRLDSTRFALLGSRSNAPFTSGGTVHSVSVTTLGAHRLAPGGRAVIDRVLGQDGFSLNGSWMNIGMGATEKSFTLAHAPTGTYVQGSGTVGDGGLSFGSTTVNGRWVRRRDETELNVKWFGAKGNGADDTAAIIATIRAARTTRTGVYLPGAGFTVTAEIKLETYVLTELNDLGLSIRGEGSEQNIHNGTMIRAGRAGMRSILSIDAGRVTVEGIRFGCAFKSDHGLYLHGASTLHLDDVHVENAVKDGYRLVGTNDWGERAINDDIYARDLSATSCGTMYCSSSDLVKSRYHNLKTVKVDGTVSCTAGQMKVIGSAESRFSSIPARAGDFILIGAADDSTLQRLEIASIDSDTEITVHEFGPPSLTLRDQPFAIGVGDGWSEQAHGDNNRVRMDTGHFTSCAGSGVVCRGLYGPLLEHQEFFGCGFAGIVIGTLDSAVILPFNTRISSPYFENTPFYGGCIFLAQARGITIDQPMWLGQPDHRRLVMSEFESVRSGIIGYLADYVSTPTATGLHPVGATTTSDIPTVRGKHFTNIGKLVLPSSGALDIGSSPWRESIPIPERNNNVQVNRGTLEAPADIVAEPTFAAGTDGQEIAICNIGIHPVTFHDGRGPGPKTTLVLDSEPGGTVSLGARQIIMFHYSNHNSMKGTWTQRGPVATSVPVLSSLDRNVTSAAGGDLITITGTNLAKATNVNVGGLNGSAPITANPTATSLTFKMPARNAGKHNVLVTTGRGASNILSIEVR